MKGKMRIRGADFSKVLSHRLVIPAGGSLPCVKHSRSDSGCDPACLTCFADLPPSF